MPGGGANLPPNFFFENSYWQNCLTELFLFLWTFNMVVDVMISKKIPPDKIFPRSYMDFEQKYQKDPGMNRVKGPQKKKKRLKYNRGKRWEGREGGA